jgi:hypothetical protein
MYSSLTISPSVCRETDNKHSENVDFLCYTSSQSADELLNMNMVITGAIMQSRKEIPETLKKRMELLR